MIVFPRPISSPRITCRRFFQANRSQFSPSSWYSKSFSSRPRPPRKAGDSSYFSYSTFLSRARAVALQRYLALSALRFAFLAPLRIRSRWSSSNALHTRHFASPGAR